MSFTSYLPVQGRHVTLVCRLKIYNPVKEVCLNGHVFCRATTSTASYTPTLWSSYYAEPEPVHVTEHKTSSIKRRICRCSSILECNGTLYCGRNEGYRCCGFGVYHPVSQTCCRQTNATFKIQDDKPEKKHICCNLEVYERSSPNARCEHPASNDKFFRNPRKNLRTNNRICHESHYVYRIDIKRQKNGHYLTANVGMWAWSPTSNRVTMRIRKSPTHRKEMDIKLDKYSPTVKIHKSFLIFSKYNYLKDSVFVLNPNEVLYESPKDNKRTVRVLKNVHENCLVDLVNKLLSPGDAVETSYIAIKSSRSSKRRIRYLKMD
ncbi:uncharacterized protein LOC123551762 [Mercenaria mercenaria]|uniref:uncharacterized protein LOC123551762 n=1 Tax=Mercenaria mercenaria TaxID=6596 RepID=UPI00234ED613|nr:uncharacterized protein LOC123551762 [Mercenaria mercenaria]